MSENSYLVVAEREKAPWVAKVRQAVLQFGKVQVMTRSQFRKQSSKESAATAMVIIDGSDNKSLDFIGHAQLKFPEAWVILATSTASFEHSRRALRAGAAAVIDKNLKPSEIVQALISPSVLLIDNKPHFLKTLSESFEESGWEVHTAANAEEATRMMRDDKLGLDLAVVDVRLKNDQQESDTSGLDLAEKVAPNLPKVVWTVSDSAGVAQRAMRLRLGGQRAAEDIVNKSEPIEEIVAAASRALRRSPRRQKAREARQGDGQLDRGPGQLTPAAIREAIGGLSAELDSLKSGGEVLNNYSGYICAREVRRSASKGGRCHSCLEIWLQPESPVESKVQATSIEIHNGRDAAEVTFDIAVESDEVRFDRSRAAVTVDPESRSKPMLFKCAPDMPAGEHKVWFQVFQKNRLQQVLAAHLVIPQPETTS